MRLLYLALPVLLIVAALVLTWQAWQAPTTERPSAGAEPPRYAVTGAQWVRLGRQGQPEFRAQADAIDWFADDSVKLRNIRVDSLGGGSSPWHLEAPHGEAPPRERRLLLTGDVQAYADESRGAPISFTTTRLWVDLLRRELHTEAPVRLSTDFRNATARGLRADFDGERVQLLNEVQVDYVPEG